MKNPFASSLVSARFVGLLGVLALAVLSARASAMPNPRVQDDGGFFSQSAIAKANEQIAQIKKDFGRDLFIQTQPSIPDTLKANYRPEDRGAFFRTWADELGKQNDVQGVIVLISKDPSYLQVRSGKGTIKQGFIGSDIDALSTRMLDRLKAKQNDEALLAGVQFVADTFAKSLPKQSTDSAAAVGAGVAGAQSSGAQPAGPQSSGAQPSGTESSRQRPGEKGAVVPAPTEQPRSTPAPRGGWSMSTLLCLAAGAFVIFMLVRGLFSARRGQQDPRMMGRHGFGDPGNTGGMGPGQGYANQPGGMGGGMGRGLLGGLMGGMLGGYMYDKFRGQGGGGEGGSTLGDGGAAAGGGSFDAPQQSEPGDFGSGGGDYSGGGGDFGGGDGGGGDGGGGGDF